MSKIYIILVVFAATVATQEEKTDETSHLQVLRCRFCGEAITNIRDVFCMESRQAVYKYNTTILQQPILTQGFTNPQGHEFELITARKSSVQSVGEPFMSATWFEGYSWRIAICPHCRVHLGWHFEEAKSQTSDTSAMHRVNNFTGIILNRVSMPFEHQVMYANAM